ncbi:hypothetical protein H9638_05310 [Arthrobacter sp. Sa2BUA2]|uniref:Uncharacterized protein n=1 Tax=Arthrobacter pullicola TaxID=2762224 RepID=A0ABR8YG76_9MICC|nr:hypothetical protein [Arthrobacter pullicola]MBD8043228.1 hypothetical protein [Arthrobacter pullicola]
MSQTPDDAPGTASPSWATYTVVPADLQFQYRTDWSVEEAATLANDPAGGVSLRVHDGGGSVIAWLDTGIITDQICTPLPEPVTYTEYDAAPMPELRSAQGTVQRFVYRSVVPAGGETAQVTYAVVSAPPPSAEEAACGLFDFFTLTESSGGRFAGVVPAGGGGEVGVRPEAGVRPDAVAGAGAESNVEEHLRKAVVFAQSQEFRDVKRMLVSLRNAD